MSKANKLAQRQVSCNNHDISISLTGDVGCIVVSDNGLYADDDSRTYRRDLGFNSMMIPLMTRSDLKRIKVAIKEVLKNSR